MSHRRAKHWWLQLALYLRGRGRSFGLLLALVLLATVCNVLKPWPLKLVVDHVLTGAPLPDALDWLRALPRAETPAGLLAWLAGAVLFLFVCAEAAQLARMYLQTGIGARMVYQLGADLFGHLQRLSLRYHSRSATGDLVRRVTGDTVCVQELIMGVAVPFAVALANLTAMCAVMWRLNPVLTIVAAGIVLPLGVVIRVYSTPMTERTYEQQRFEGELMTSAERTLTALPVIQAFGQEDAERERFRSVANSAYTAHLRATQSQILFSASATSVTAAGTALLMAVGGLQVLAGTLTLGGLLVFLSYLASLYAPVETMAFASAGFYSARAKARRVFEVMHSTETLPEPASPRKLPSSRARGEVCLRAVTFGYDPGRPVLHGVSLDVRPGESLALAGSTGAGKTTLVSLIPRFFDVWDGRVELDGIDVRDLTLAELRAQVAIVGQEPFLLPVTIAQNIACGRPGATDAEIVQAARMANAHEFIERLPQGYETLLGDRGATLSGGERQRISIARALLKAAPVLILDEPSAALDAESEQSVMDALRALMAHRTTFVVAHRLSTVRRMDRIAVLEAGRIVEMGTHDSLLAANGRYAALYAAHPGRKP